MEQNKDNILKEFFVEDLNLKLFIHKPSVKILRDSRFRYNKAFTNALREGYFTRKKLEESLKQGEINIIDLHVQKRAEILDLYANVNKNLEDATDPETIEYYAGLLSFYRDVLVKEDMDMNNLFSTTADQSAEDSRLDFLVFSLVKNEDGSPVWPTEEAYNSETRLNLVEASKYNIICWEYKLDPDWQKTLPEVQAMVKAKEVRDLIEKEAEAKSHITQGDSTVKTKKRKPRKLKKIQKTKTKAIKEDKPIQEQ